MVIIRLSDPLAEAFFSCSILFSSSYPPHQRAKRNSRTGEKAEPPKREPATFHGATDARRSGVKSDFDFARSEAEKANV